MLITKSNTIEEGMRKHTLKKEINIGPLSLQFITIIFLAVLALFYLAQSTQSATKTYKARESEDQKSQLEGENQRLQIEIIRLKSLNEIKNGIQSINLEPTKESGYIPPTYNQTARR